MPEAHCIPPSSSHFKLQPFSFPTAVPFSSQGSHARTLEREARATNTHTTMSTVRTFCLSCPSPTTITMARRELSAVRYRDRVSETGLQSVRATPASASKADTMPGALLARPCRVQQEVRVILLGRPITRGPLSLTNLLEAFQKEWRGKKGPAGAWVTSGFHPRRR